MALTALALLLGLTPLLESCAGRESRRGRRASADPSRPRDQSPPPGSPGEDAPPDTRRAARGAKTIEPGIWELNVTGSYFDPGGIEKPTQIMSHNRVRVVVSRLGDREIVTLELVDDTRPEEAEPMTGYIREDVLNPGTFRFEAVGKDKAFEFQLSGEIRSPDLVIGVAVGVAHNDSSRGFEGRFSFKKTG